MLALINGALGYLAAMFADYLKKGVEVVLKSKMAMLLLMAAVFPLIKDFLVGEVNRIISQVRAEFGDLALPEGICYVFNSVELFHLMIIYASFSITLMFVKLGIIVYVKLALK
ncbi:hypothetical protein [Sulfurovum sp.]|uniref:hypothetical protein n=1 Tax=Sulfurovum sp. TaxID=1969726 RepID=UPI0028682B38|nr:hypothetical protein [Sulfurovum sp.]